MLIGIGIDILSLPRFTSLISRRSPHALAKRICSAIELKAFVNQKDENIVRFLSTRWVLKEAAYKALSARYTVSWKSLEVDYLPSGQPVMRYLPTSSNERPLHGGDVDLMCTLSHDAGLVVGVVIAQKVG